MQFDVPGRGDTPLACFFFLLDRQLDVPGKGDIPLACFFFLLDRQLDVPGRGDTPLACFFCLLLNKQLGSAREVGHPPLAFVFIIKQIWNASKQMRWCRAGMASARRSVVITDK